MTEKKKELFEEGVDYTSGPCPPVEDPADDLPGLEVLADYDAEEKAEDDK